ncbi:MAG: efflux RND transporter periplasmic adaptor subunit [Pseudomonadota bacterium]
MKNSKKLIAITMVSALALSGASFLVKTSPVFASADGHGGAEAEHKDHAEDKGEVHGDEHGDERGDEENKLAIDPQAAADMKIEVSEAGAAMINVSIPVTGRVALNKNMIAEVQGRFEGIVKSVEKTEGEHVKAGETLATVESNESLQPYAVKAPIGGIILKRSTNVGHIAAGAESMFMIADLSKLWIEFNVFAKDITAVAVGQKIRGTVVGNHLSVETKISSILPVADSISQTVIARAAIDNAEGKWRPGMSVHGEIFTQEKSVPVAIKVSAIQRMEGNTVVFVQKDGSYEERKVKLGLQDGTNAEVLEGLQAGERYVATGSFVLKAHAGKAGAEHAH